MPALANRTRIKSVIAKTPITTGIIYRGSQNANTWIQGMDIDANAYMIASGSIKVQTLPNIPELSVKGREILHKLYKFRQLHPNWDGNGAETPKESVVNKAANFLTNADEFDLPIYFTAPGPNGEIVLEYKKGENIAEIYFEDDNTSEMILYKGKQQVYVGQTSLSQLISHIIPTATNAG